LTIAGCEWSYEGPPDKPGTPAKAHQLTACSGQKGQSPSQWQHADSFITQWQRMPTQVLISALEKKLSYSKGAPIEPQIDIMQAWHKQKPITRQLIWSALTKAAGAKVRLAAEEADGGEDASFLEALAHAEAKGSDITAASAGEEYGDGGDVDTDL